MSGETDQKTCSCDNPFCALDHTSADTAWDAGRFADGTHPTQAPEIGRRYWIDVRCPTPYAGKLVKAVERAETSGDVVVEVDSRTRVLIGGDWLKPADTSEMQVQRGETALCSDSAVQEPPPEIVEARNEAATVRRAYLHERHRARTAIEELRPYAPARAARLETQEYREYGGPRSEQPPSLIDKIDPRVLLRARAAARAVHESQSTDELAEAAVSLIVLLDAVENAG